MTHSIYRITNKLNNKHYIGQATRIKARWSGHRGLARNVLAGATLQQKAIQVIHLAIAKHGVDNFEFVILEEMDTQEQANYREKYWIHYYNSLKNGYNCVPGGKVLSGTDHPGYGKPGRKLTDEAKEQIRQSLLGVKHTEERKRNMSKASGTRGKPNCRRKLTFKQAQQIRQEYSKGLSQRHLAKLYNVNQRSIWAIVNNNTYTI